MHLLSRPRRAVCYISRTDDRTKPAPLGRALPRKPPAAAADRASQEEQKTCPLPLTRHASTLFKGRITSVPSARGPE